MNIKKFVVLILMLSLLAIIPTSSAFENGSDVNAFCNALPPGVKVDIDLSKISPESPLNITDRNRLATEINEMLLDPTIDHQSYISNIGQYVTFRSKTWTTPPTYMLHMGVNALLIYSPDLVNWYSTGMTVQATETGYQATYVDAQTTVSVTGNRYYMTWGCHQGGEPDYHYDDYSGYIYVS